MVPEEFALHSVMIGAATRLSTERAPEVVAKKEGGWSSNAFTVYVRENMKHPAWASEVLGHGAGEYERELGQRTRRG